MVVVLVVVGINEYIDLPEMRGLWSTDLPNNVCAIDIYYPKAVLHIFMYNGKMVYIYEVVVMIIYIYEYIV